MVPVWYLQGKQAIWRGLIFPNTQLRLHPREHLGRAVDVTGRALADTHQVAPKRAKLEQVIERGDSINLAERKAEFVGCLLEPLLGKIAIVVLDFLQHGDQGIGLATI